MRPSDPSRVAVNPQILLTKMLISDYSCSAWISLLKTAPRNSGGTRYEKSITVAWIYIAHPRSLPRPRLRGRSTAIQCRGFQRYLGLRCQRDSYFHTAADWSNAELLGMDPGVAADRNRGHARRRRQRRAQRNADFQRQRAGLFGDSQRDLHRKLRRHRNAE